jgi:hypothetical protein
MNHLTINQATARVNSATRLTKESVAIDYDTLMEALNAALDSDLTGLPEPHQGQWMRTRIMNQLQALAMNEGRRWKSKLWSEQGRTELEKLALAPWASRRRHELLE